MSAPREHPTRPAAGMWGEGGKSKRAVLRWPSQTPTRRFGEEPEPQDAEVPIKQVRDKTEPRDRISIFSPESRKRPERRPERLARKRNRKRRWAGPVGGASASFKGLMQGRAAVERAAAVAAARLPAPEHARQPPRRPQPRRPASRRQVSRGGGGGGGRGWE